MTYTVSPKGPPDSPIVVLGEAPGDNEVAFNKPFVGKSGVLLDEMLQEAGFDPKSLYFLNVFPIQPPKNKVEYFFAPKKDGLTTIPPIGPGKYLKPEFFEHIVQLKTLLLAHPRTLIIALGNTALWATCGTTGIGSLRGNLRQANEELANLVVLPTYHPSAVLRTYSLRSVVVQDLCKAQSFCTGDLATPSDAGLTLHLNPTVGDLPFLRNLALSAPALGVDVETERDQIRTFGVATSELEGFVIPFFCTKSGVANYWPTLEHEMLALQVVIDICQSDIPKVFQNGLYDLQRILFPYGVAVKGVGPGKGDDTMLLHHALQPEMTKGLDFLASIYLNTPAWKAEFRRGANEQGKRDE